MAEDDRLIYLISRAQHCLKTYMKKAFEEQGLYITPVQAGILFLLRKNDHTMTGLSRILTIDNSAITGLVDRLEKAGLAMRMADPKDRRAYVIHITDKGKKQIDKALVIVTRVNNEIKAGFSEEEMDTFKNVINSFFDKFSKPSLTKPGR